MIYFAWPKSNRTQLFHSMHTNQDLLFVDSEDLAIHRHHPIEYLRFVSIWSYRTLARLAQSILNLADLHIQSSQLLKTSNFKRNYPKVEWFALNIADCERPQGRKTRQFEFPAKIKKAEGSNLDWSQRFAIRDMERLRLVKRKMLWIAFYLSERITSNFQFSQSFQSVNREILDIAKAIISDIHWFQSNESW